MKRGSSNQAMLAAGLLLAIVTPAFGQSDPNDPNRYLNAVREFADNVLKYGRDTYGPKHTPLFVDGLNIHTHEPVRWIDPDGTRWILSDLASQQTLFRTLDALTTVTSDRRYRQAAMDAIKYAFARLQAPSGLLYWGQVAAYDAQGDRVYGNQHCLKLDYPYYDLMWSVDPNATQAFIEAFWSASVLDWSSLDMNRYSQIVGPVRDAWNHEYRGGPTFFQGRGLGFFTTGTSLAHAGADLSRFSGQEQSLLWSKRLIRRYVDTRHPKTGISAFLYNGRWSSMLVDDLTEGFADPHTTVFPLLPFEEARGMYHPLNQQALPWISLFLVGDTLGEQGRDFTRWALEELTAWGKTAYRRKDNSFIPILTDGTSIEGYVCKETLPSLGPKGAVAKALPADMTFFWAYSTAYRATGDAFMWQMTRDIALGNNVGDIGETPSQTPSLQSDAACSDVFGLLGFLELFRKTKSPAFLEMAQRVGDNVLDSQFRRGFFVLSKRHIYTRFDCFEALALLHLHAATRSEMGSLPQVWPSSPLFVAPYRQKEQGNDRRYIYTLTESAEPPLSLQEAATMGEVDLVRSLLEKGVPADSWDDNLKKTGLQRAAMNGHKEVVALLLNKGARVDAKDSFPGGTALSYAAEKGHMEIVEMLIARGANVNAASTAWGNTPVHVAVAAGYETIVELLAAKGADLNIKNSDGFAPLHYAVSRGRLSWWETQVGDSSTPNDLAVAQLLLTHGADVNAKTNDGRSSMDIALGENRTEMVELLASKGVDISIHTAVSLGNVDRLRTCLDKGADVNANDKDGQTPLHLAARNKQKDAAELLISRGADLTAKDNRNYTPLFYAIFSNDANMVGLLANRDADVSYSPEKGYPPLHFAVWFENPDMARVLIDHGARFDVKDQDGWTALRYAASAGNWDLVNVFVAKGADVSSLHLAACVGNLARVKSLLEQGANVDTKDELGWTPLYWAASLGRTEVAASLIDKGAKVEAKTNDDSTPLHQAAQAGVARLVDLLVSKGADVKAKDKNGRTPLHEAASASRHEVVELLIAKGADVNAKTTNDWTPLHMAALAGHKDIIGLLIANGADVNAKDNQGRTALALAKQRGHTEILGLLQ